MSGRTEFRHEAEVLTERLTEYKLMTFKGKFEHEHVELGRHRLCWVTHNTRLSHLLCAAKVRHFYVHSQAAQAAHECRNPRSILFTQVLFQQNLAPSVD